jgi:hypothetical protein
LRHPISLSDVLEIMIIGAAVSGAGGFQDRVLTINLGNRSFGRQFRDQDILIVAPRYRIGPHTTRHCRQRRDLRQHFCLLAEQISNREQKCAIMTQSILSVSAFDTNLYYDLALGAG